MSKPTVWLVTPPLTQLNMPYPATAVLTGFLTQQGYTVTQTDLGIHFIDALYTPHWLGKLFSQTKPEQVSPPYKKMLSLAPFYLNTVEPVKRFLRTADNGLAYRIISRTYLPEGPRFANADQSDFQFGPMGITERAKYLATLYMQDLADFIRLYADAGFELVRYHDKLSAAAPTFDALYHKLTQSTASLTDELLLQCFMAKFEERQPTVVGFSVPFPGNLYAALKCAHYLKQHQPQVKIVLGGGYITTELRQITDARLFEFTDYLVFDDGEQPFLNLLKHFEGHSIEWNNIYRLNGNSIEKGKTSPKPLAFKTCTAPDYTGIDPNQYLSMIETANPMHKLWSDGFWNKLTLAHGCYWAKCSFCDINLDYIARFEQVSATETVEKIKQIIAQTGRTGFHFTDEAAPPSLLKNLALELLRQNISITWWGNIRFETTFSPDLCKLLAASGCIAVTGGIETASDRLLALMNKGVTLEHAAQVTRNFTDAGIMVHAYLMYGFPTQTLQETVNSLEVVRQFFQQGLIQSGFWHRFALTVHSGVAAQPEKFGIVICDKNPNPFANNELAFTDKVVEAYPDAGAGLNKAIFNYMHGEMLDLPVHKWFEFKAPMANIPPQWISQNLKNKPNIVPNRQALWLGGTIQCSSINSQDKLYLNSLFNGGVLNLSSDKSQWLQSTLEKLQPAELQPLTFTQLQASYNQLFNAELETEPWFRQLLKSGLLFI